MENSHRRDYSTYRQTGTRGVRIPRTNVLWIFPYYRGHTSEYDDSDMTLNVDAQQGQPEAHYPKIKTGLFHCASNCT